MVMVWLSKMGKYLSQKIFFFPFQPGVEGGRAVLDIALLLEKVGGCAAGEDLGWVEYIVTSERQGCTPLPPF